MIHIKNVKILSTAGEQGAAKVRDILPPPKLKL